jgi:hypothetical protein
MTVLSLFTPRSSRSRFCARTMSRMVMTGNRIPYGRPVSGSGEAGPVLPEQPPSTFEHTTKLSSVSTGRPGPTISSHQPPRLYASEAPPEQWESPVSAWTTRQRSLR